MKLREIKSNLATVTNIKTKTPKIPTAEQIGLNIPARHSFMNLINNLHSSCFRDSVNRPFSEKNLLVFTGPPLNTEKDNELAHFFMNFTGQKAICGGTTANIVSRELQRSIETEMSSGDIPGISIMQGVDLITEGILTLSRVLHYLKNPPPEKNRDAAYQLTSLLLENDIITFILGGKINKTYFNPAWPYELKQRETVVIQITEILKDKYMKNIEIIIV